MENINKFISSIDILLLIKLEKVKVMLNLEDT